MPAWPRQRFHASQPRRARLAVPLKWGCQSNTAMSKNRASSLPPSPRFVFTVKVEQLVADVGRTDHVAVYDRIAAGAVVHCDALVFGARVKQLVPLVRLWFDVADVAASIAQ